MTILYYALDLQDDPRLIAEYEAWHRRDRIWPGVVRSLYAAGIEEAEIFRTGNRLLLVLRVGREFDAVAKAAADAADPTVQAWEALMWRFQQALPWARPGEKWVSMQRIFSLQAASADELPPAA